MSSLVRVYCSARVSTCFWPFPFSMVRVFPCTWAPFRYSSLPAFTAPTSAASSFPAFPVPPCSGCSTPVMAVRLVVSWVVKVRLLPSPSSTVRVFPARVRLFTTWSLSWGTAPRSWAVRITTPPLPLTLTTFPVSGAAASARAAAASALAAEFSEFSAPAVAVRAAVSAWPLAFTARVAAVAAVSALVFALAAACCAVLEYSSTRATKVSYWVGLISTSPSVFRVL